MRHDEGPTSQMDVLIAEWKLLLTKLVRLSDEQAHEWVIRRTEAIGDDGSWVFFHETPQYFIVPLLIPSNLRDRLSAQERSMLVAMLDGAIRPSGTPPFTSPQFDWDAASARVEAILARHHSSS